MRPRWSCLQRRVQEGGRRRCDHQLRARKHGLRSRGNQRVLSGGQHLEGIGCRRLHNAVRRLVPDEPCGMRGQSSRRGSRQDELCCPVGKKVLGFGAQVGMTSLDGSMALHQFNPTSSLGTVETWASGAGAAAGVGHRGLRLHVQPQERSCPMSCWQNRIRRRNQPESRGTPFKRPGRQTTVWTPGIRVRAARSVLKARSSGRWNRNDSGRSRASTGTGAPLSISLSSA